MDLSIIIVNYNTAQKALACLGSIFRANLTGIDFEVILVDNASSELIEAKLTENFPQVVMIKSQQNLGMGGGNNLGIARASGKYVLVLNPDTEVGENSITIMMDYLSANPKAGLVGPKLLYPDRTAYESAFRFPKFFIPILRRTSLGIFATKYIDNYLMKDVDLSEPRVVDWVQGSCMLIKKEVLEKIGEFDERFFLYLEDTDLCKRVGLAGWQVVYLPTTEVIHYHERASAQKPWYFAPFINKQSRIHIISWLKYFLKWKFK